MLCPFANSVPTAGTDPTIRERVMSSPWRLNHLTGRGSSTAP
jgi:hypothetical protein